jgi:predicted metal-dependent HD superfamily phosphohydrolase
VRELLERWAAAVRGAGGTASAAEVEAAGRALLDRWGERHRHYHTVAHLCAVLDRLDATADHAARPDLARLAAWWHDAVYDPRAGGDANERASAELAIRELTALGVPAATAGEVARLVRLTGDHVVADGDRDGAVLCDADLAVLAAAPGDYDRYAHAVRREYGHVPEGAFRAGRAAVLCRLLDLPALYRVPAVRAALEASARANLRRELDRLIPAGRADAPHPAANPISGPPPA